MVFENGELKCVGVFEGDVLKRKEREFEKELMMEYDDEGKMVYWGGYVKKNKRKWPILYRILRIFIFCPRAKK